MISKIKDWLFGKVIFTKVLGKFVKHATGALTGILFGDKIPFIKDAFEAGGMTEIQVQAGLIVFLTGLFGAIWNYIEHRAKK